MNKKDQTFGVDNVDYNVFDYLLNKYNINNMVDVGCGWGGMVKHALGKNIDAIGVDFFYRENIFDRKEFFCHDYSRGPFVLDRVFDLGWSIEFLEHIEEKYIDNIFSTFLCCKMICCTHALLLERGPYHINCQDSEYWIDIFKRYGFVYDVKESGRIRIKSKMKDIRNNNHKYYMKRSGMIFLNKRYK